MIPRPWKYLYMSEGAEKSIRKGGDHPAGSASRGGEFIVGITPKGDCPRPGALSKWGRTKRHHLGREHRYGETQKPPVPAMEQGQHQVRVRRAGEPAPPPHRRP